MAEELLDWLDSAEALPFRRALAEFLATPAAEPGLDAEELIAAMRRNKHDSWVAHDSVGAESWNRGIDRAIEVVEEFAARLHVSASEEPTHDDYEDAMDMIARGPDDIGAK